MHTMIVPVGTSLIENYRKNYWKYLSHLSGFVDFESHPSFRPFGEERKSYTRGGEEGGTLYHLWEEKKACSEEIEETLCRWICNVRCEKWLEKDGRRVVLHEEDNYINQYSCAEIQTIFQLIRKNKLENLKVYLLSSDSLSGMLCAETIAYCLDNITIESCEVRVIFAPENDWVEGLSFYDGKTFEKKGVRNLTEKVGGIIEQHAANAIHLCVSGGFKGAVPILTLLAQAYRIPVLYQFEDSYELIEYYLPEIILSERARDVIRFLQADYQPESNYENWLKDQKIYEEERRELETFIEREDGFVALSIVGEVFSSQCRK